MSLTIRHAELANSIRLPYVEGGNRSGLPTLLLHGFAGTWREWGAMLSKLPNALHAYALTQRGHGEASKPAGRYDIGHWATDATAFMDSVELEAAVIVGHSMGSAVALRLAAKHPGRTLGLVLVGACVDEPGDPRMRAYWDSTVSELSDPMDPSFVRRFLQSTLARPVPTATFDELVEEALKVPARVWKAAFRARLELDTTADLNRVEAPTLLLWGEQDGHCSREGQEALLAALPDARLLTYADVGHSPHIEEPGRFATDLTAFVRDVADRT